MDAAHHRAARLALRAGRVLVVGSDRDVLRFAGAQRRVIDLHGCAALPGFIETSTHPLRFGASRRGRVDVSTRQHPAHGDDRRHRRTRRRQGRRPAAGRVAPW